MKNLKIKILSILLAFYASSLLASQLNYSIINKDKNSFKNDTYYKIMVKVNGSYNPSNQEIEKICTSLDNEKSRKFSAMFYLSSIKSMSFAYANCSRLQDEKLKITIFN